MSETLQESSVPSDSIAEELPKARESSDRSSEDLLVQEGDIAGDYLERLLDLLDYDGDIDLDVDAGRAVVSIDGGEDLEKLVGPRGSVLEALQELTRLAVQQETGARSRLMLDVAGWRAARREELRELGRSAAEPVDRAYRQLRDGAVDFVGGSAHSALAAFPEWNGVKLLCAQAQGMYWFLVMRADLGAARGDLSVVKGRTIGAAPWVEMGLRRLLIEAGIDLERDWVTIAPVPGATGTGSGIVNFGVTAARASKPAASTGSGPTAWEPKSRCAAGPARSSSTCGAATAPSRLQLYDVKLGRDRPADRGFSRNRSGGGARTGRDP